MALGAGGVACCHGESFLVDELLFRNSNYYGYW